jgi:flavorubredoxin
MKCTRDIAPGIAYVGASDRRLALFENLFPLDSGVSYNSYLIRDGKTALMDTIDASVSRQFLENVAAALDGRTLDYLVVTHMEPDHCATIGDICRLYPDAKIVGNKKTFTMIGQFFRGDLSSRFHEVKEGDELALGTRTLKFLTAPMVHWPEVMVALETSENILFSADAFGTFGAANGNLFSDETDFESLFLDEARRYYTNIVGKYGPQVLAALAKLGSNVPSMICPLHGPVLRGSAIPFLVEKYTRWASYAPEKRGVVVAYASMYGHTESAALALANSLSEKGVRDMRVFDVSKTHCSRIVAAAFEYSHLVLAAPTYNMHLYSAMDALLRDMAALNLQGRKAALIGNGSWAPMAHKAMASMLGEMKNMEVIGAPLVLLSSMKPEQAAELETLAEQIAASVAAE